MVASIPLPCTAWNRPASARKDPGEATGSSAAAVSSSDRLLLEPSSLRTAALCTGAGSLPLDTGIGTHDHLGAALATSQIAPLGRSLIGLLQRSILKESIALRQTSISSGRKAGLASPGKPAGCTHRAGRGCRQPKLEQPGPATRQLFSTLDCLAALAPPTPKLLRLDPPTWGAPAARVRERPDSVCQVLRLGPVVVGR